MKTIEDIKEQCREAIRLGEAATKGPWDHTVKCYIQHGKEIVADCHWTQKGEMRQNANFIASSRSFTPRAAKALLVTIDYIEREEGKGRMDSDDAQDKLNELCASWEESK